MCLLALCVIALVTSCNQLITAAGGVVAVPVISVSLNKSSGLISIGKTEQLAVSFTPATATDTTGAWKSSDPAVASVSETGVVTGIGPGKATITFTSNSGSKAAICEVSCGYNFSSFAGFVLSVDSNKHFTTKAEYDNGSYHAVFNTDGSFEEIWYDDYSLTASATQSDGYRGTYTWDPANYTLIRNITCEWDSDTKAWDYTYGGSTSYVATSYKVFTEHQILSVYQTNGIANPTKWNIVYTYVYKDQTNSDNNWKIEHIYDYSIATSDVFSFAYTRKWYTATVLAGYTRYSEIEEGTYIANPDGTSLTPGNTVTYRVTPTVSQSQSYNDSTGKLDDPVLFDRSISSYTFMNTGSYLIAPTALQARSLSVAP